MRPKTHCKSNLRESSTQGWCSERRNLSVNGKRGGGNGGVGEDDHTAAGLHPSDESAAEERGQETGITWGRIPSASPLIASLLCGWAGL